MKNVCAMTVVLVLGLGLNVYGTVLPIGNAGFEDYVLTYPPAAAVAASSTTVPSWDLVSGSDYLFRLDSHPTQFYGLVQSGGIRDHLTMLPEYEGQTFTLGFSAGSPAASGTIDLLLYFSPDAWVTQTLVTIGVTSTWADYSIDYTIPANNGNVYFRFDNNNTAWIGLDDFTAEVVPEPTTIGLLSVGLLGLLRRRR